MRIGQLITGITLIFLGLVLAVTSFFSTFFFLIYSGILLILGIVILFNKEDEIEKIKTKRFYKR